ncbi:MAG: APC family permease, partial [Bryobacteraceae bacterium]
KPLPAGSAQAGNESRELAGFGYKQQLKRTIRGFSSFALSFSLISMTTGIFGDFGQGLRHAGPAVIWSWCAAVIGQLLVALIIAELSAHYPLSGYGYQWTSRLTGPRFGFFTGWLLLVQWITALPGICGVVSEYFAGLARSQGFVTPGWFTVPVITVAVISAAALIHIFSIKLAAMWNNAGVITEILGSVGVALVLLYIAGIHPPHGFRFLLNHTSHYTGQPAHLTGFVLSLLVGAWCLTGFEAAADLAEETQDPLRTVPRAVISSELASGIGGFLVIAGFLLSIRNLHAAQASDTPLLDILISTLGLHAAQFVLLVVFVSVFACALASLALTSRLLFAMARDNMFPFSKILSRVNARHGTPIPAIVFVWFVSCAVVLLLKRLELFTSTSVVAGYLAYASILYSALRGLRGKVSEHFRLGRWRMPIGVTALLWCLFITASMTIPESEPGAGHIPALAAGIGIAMGILVYLFAIRGRLRRGEAGVPGQRESGH